MFGLFLRGHQKYSARFHNVFRYGRSFEKEPSMRLMLGRRVGSGKHSWVFDEIAFQSRCNADTDCHGISLYTGSHRNGVSRRGDIVGTCSYHNWRYRCFATLVLGRPFLDGGCARRHGGEGSQQLAPVLELAICL